MCLPMAALGAIAGLAGTAIQIGMQMSLARKNERAQQEWADYQRAARIREGMRQEENRAQADAARMEGLEQISGDKQIAAQQDEAQRLNEYLTTDTTEGNVSDNLLSGQQRGSEVFNETLGSRLADAAAKAKERIAALANLTAFGGSQGGLPMMIQNAQQQSANSIDLFNNKRSGSLSAYGAEKAVNPVQYFGGGGGGAGGLVSALGSLPQNLVAQGAYSTGAGTGFFGG